MKIGMYLNTTSLLWVNGKDKDHTQAIRELRFKKNNIQRLVIKLNGVPTYPTKILIQWFMNQKFTSGEQFTHRLSSRIPDKVTTVSRKRPYKYRHWVPSLLIKTGNKDIWLQPGAHMENIAMGMSQQKADYNLIASMWKYTPPELPSIPQEIKNTSDFQPALLQALANAYEVSINDTDLIDAYIQSHIQISRLPQDEVVFGWFVELGIAPSSSSLDNPTDYLFDEDTTRLYGKDELLDDTDYLLEDAN